MHPSELTQPTGTVKFTVTLLHAPLLLLPPPRHEIRQPLPTLLQMHCQNRATTPTLQSLSHQSTAPSLALARLGLHLFIAITEVGAKFA